MVEVIPYEQGYDPFGLESPFASGAVGYEDNPWSGEAAKPQMRAAPRTDDPPQLADMLAIPGRFDDPKRDAALEFDGTRFGAFLPTRDRRQFAADWLASRPALALAAREPGADLTAGDIAKAWFVVHDIGVPGSVTDRRFQAKDPKTKKGAVHGYLNRGGYYAATNDFDKNRMGTVYEFLSRKGVAICGKKTINIETAPDIEKFDLNANGSLPPPTNPERYASIGYRRLGKADAAAQKHTHFYYKWTVEAFDVLADLYILASARAGHLLTITAHKEVDRNLGKSVIWREYSAKELRAPKNTYLLKARDHPSDYHGDPFAFDMQALYDRITARLNALGGLQIPAGARYGVHPLRLRKSNGQDVGNGDSQLHEFPHQSDPIVKTDGNLKKAGWWKASGDGESWEESPWSAGEWAASLAENADFEAPDQEELAMCGTHEHDHEGGFAEPEGLAWLDMQGEAGVCPHCGASENSDEQAWSESDYEGGDAAYEVPSSTGTGTASILQEADYETPRSAAPYALLAAIPDDANVARHIPLEYRLDAKAMVGKLAVDLEQLKTPDAKEIASFGKELFDLVREGNPASMMVKILKDVLENIPNAYLGIADNAAKEWAARGFSRAVVLGAERVRSKKYLIDMFGRERIPPNNIFPYARKVAAANYAGGLLAGYVQGRALSDNQRKIFFKDMVSRMGSQSWRGPVASWSHNRWQEWYVDFAAAFWRWHL